ncbi:MAG: hypothetical protein HQL87_15715 [Magnetococcales bacterium]|nr:hypothetical protein [Magnetococcales bacterium]
MTFKILLPVLVGLLLYFLGKSHARRSGAPVAVVRPVPPTMLERVHLSFRLTAGLLVGTTLLAAAWWMVEAWQTAHTPVVVRVINVQTGAATSYQALQGQVQGRTFHTLDGRQVRLADVERMEVGE